MGKKAFMEKLMPLPPLKTDWHATTAAADILLQHTGVHTPL